jgi:acyl dehydratase
MSLQSLATHQFDMNDQRSFAQLSGDFNPMHCDPIAARRRPFGGPVVHGVHVTLWSLLQMMEAMEVTHVSLSQLTIAFQNPVMVDELLELRLLSREQGDQGTRLQFQVWSKKILALDGSVTWRAIDDVQKQTEKETALFEVGEEQTVDLNLGLVGLSGAGLAGLKDRIPSYQVAVLLGCTQIVGMKVPGDRSIFANLNLMFDGPHESNERRLCYRVKVFHEKFNLYQLEVRHPQARGELRALTYKEFKQPTYDEIRSRGSIVPQRNEVALVVGGSRGLGELVVKILVSMGHKVYFTYVRGEADAQRIVSELRQHVDREQVNCFSYDVLDKEGLRQLDRLHHVDSLYYFATPHISPGVKNQFDEGLYRTFCGYYVQGLGRLVEVLQAKGLQRVFYPSTVFLNQSGGQFAEYKKAKHEGEEYLTGIARKGGLVAYCPRLPMLGSDQTTQVYRGNVLDSLPILTAEIEAFLDKS